MLKEIDFPTVLIAMVLVATVFRLELPVISPYIDGECPVEMVVGKDYRITDFNGILPIFEDVMITKSGKDEWVHSPASYEEQNFIHSLDDDFSGWIRVCSGQLYYQNRFRHLH